MITSSQNPRVKAVAALRDRRERERTGLMRVEGYAELALALESGARPLAVYYCPALFRDSAQRCLLNHLADAERVEVSERVFERIAYREGPDGWLAVLRALDTRLDRLGFGADPLLLVAERVEKPGNLGAMLRTADAAGVDALIAADGLTDWGNPNVVRASKGALFSVPMASASGPEVLEWLRGRGIRVVAATPEARVPYTEADLRGAVAVAVGAEKLGLSEPWLEAADLSVRIPMSGRVNSLNVATAAALLIYEAVRQRSVMGGGGSG